MSNYIENPKNAELFLQGCTCNSLGTVKDTNATDKAVLQAVEKFGYRIGEYREKYLVEGFTRFQLTSSRKKMSTILENVKESPSGKRLLTKGGADVMLKLSTHYLNENGEIEEITQLKMKEID